MVSVDQAKFGKFYSKKVGVKQGAMIPDNSVF
jgi:hypothetical protein